MLTLKDYVNWGLTRSDRKREKSRNLFDKDIKEANELIEYEKIMVNEGSKVLPYEPYVKE